MTLKSHAKTHKSLIDIYCEFEFHNLTNTKIGAKKIMVKTTYKLDLPWSAIFSVIVYSSVWPIENVYIVGSRYNELCTDPENRSLYREFVMQNGISL